MQMAGEDIIHVRRFFLKHPQGLFYKGCKERTRASVSAPECVFPCQPCIIHPATGLMEQLINGRPVYPRERLITHLQQGPDTGAPISAATVRMITDAWLGRAAEEPSPTPSPTDGLTLIGGRSCGGQPRRSRGRVQQGRNRTWKKMGVKLNRRAEGMLRGRQTLLSSQFNDVLEAASQLIIQLEIQIVQFTSMASAGMQRDGIHLLVFNRQICHMSTSLTAHCNQANHPHLMQQFPNWGRAVTAGGTIDYTSPYI